VADVNACKLQVASWIPPREWAAAPDRVRDRWLDGVCDLAASAKRRQVRLGIGSDGRPLPAVKPSSRPDGATGKPLDPHFGGSRSVKWLRAVPGRKAGTVTLYWSHGFGRILGYHARGEVIGAYIRDIIAFPPSIERTLKADARALWRRMNAPPRPRPAPSPAAIAPGPAPPTATPKRTPKPTPQPRGRKVVYLPPGVKPDPLSKDIQVET
jgi:hypothetical protein